MRWATASRAAALVLNLVYNPQGAVLPPPQGPLEADYKRELQQHFGIRFNHLFALTNMPIQRFGSTLVSKGTFAGYMQLLRGAYRAENLDTVMCRSAAQRGLAGRPVRLRLQPDARPARAAAAAEARPHLRDLLAHDPAGDGHPHRRPLLRLHRRPGQQLRRRARSGDGRDRRGRSAPPEPALESQA